MVKTHRFVYTTRRGDESSEDFEFRNDEMAILCAKALLNSDLIAIGVRRSGGPASERVGLWVWHHGQPEWKPGA